MAVAAVDRKRRLEDAGDALGQLIGRRLARDVLAEDHELIAAQPCDGVACPEAVHEPARHLEQELVSGVVAEGVVDELEVVEIHEQHRSAAVDALGPFEPVVQALAQQGSVGQAGERIVQGLVTDVLLGALALDRVGQHVGHGLEKDHVVRAEIPARARVGAQEAERVPAAADDHRRAADYLVRGESRRGQEARLAGEVLDHDVAQRAPGEAGVVARAARVLCPANQPRAPAQAGAQGQRLETLPLLEDLAELHAQPVGHHRNRPLDELADGTGLPVGPRACCLNSFYCHF